MQFFSILLLATAAVAAPAPIVNLERHATATTGTFTHHTRAHTAHTVHNAAATPPASASLAAPVASLATPVGSSIEPDATNFVKHAGMKIGIPQITSAPAI